MCSLQEHSIHSIGTCRGFVDNVKRVGKQVQGGLPIIGLISRLTSPSGGFDQQVRK